MSGTFGGSSTGNGLHRLSAVIAVAEPSLGSAAALAEALALVAGSALAAESVYWD